jgi:type III pantothenate kinase
MRIAIDMGNTETAVALFDRERIAGVRRIKTARFLAGERPAGLLEDALAGLRSEDPVTRDAAIEGSVVASVVPEAAPALLAALSGFHHGEPLVVGPSIDLGIRIGYERPEELGPDRIADAVAGFAKAGGAVIVIDLGTATTFNAVTADGTFLGGAIAPGVRTGAEALGRAASRLFTPDLRLPERSIGRSTDEALRSGILWGAVEMVDGMADRMRKEMGGAAVLATGGLAPLVAPRSRVIESSDELLTLKGLKLLYERNRADRSPAPRA